MDKGKEIAHETTYESLPPEKLQRRIDNEISHVAAITGTSVRCNVH